MTEHNLDAFTRQLRQRDPRFLRVVSTNPAERQGEYEIRVATTGNLARVPFVYDEDGDIIMPHFDCATKARLAAAAAPSDPYAEGLRKTRAAQATDASRFEDAYKESRRAEFAASIVDHTPPSRLSDADLAEYAPPDPYAEPIRALQQKERRR